MQPASVAIRRARQLNFAETAVGAATQRTRRKNVDP